MRRRRAVGGVLAVLACATAAPVAFPATAADAKDELGFEIVRISRFGGDRDGNGVLDPSPGLEGLPRSLKRIPLVIRPTPAACAPNARWSLDGKSLGAVTCTANVLRLNVTVAAIAPSPDHELEVRVGERTERRTFQVRDRLVVVLGDSVASGEGNPTGGRLSRDRWLERRCHRSAAAGFEQAARVLAQANPTISLTFVSLACSGATIPEGLLGPYRGIEQRKGQPLESQARRLGTIDAARPVNSVLVSVGANDVHFADLVRHCILKHDCPSKRFDPEHTGARTDADTAVALALARLSGRYDTLAGKLNKLVDRPGDVILTEYFDPTVGANGRTCHPIIGGRITTSELRWAQDAVLTPLNQEAAAAAHRNGWQLVGGIARDFARHGYCTSRPDRWVRTLPEALPIVTGTMHPNERGHLAIAGRVGPVLSGTLQLAGPQPEPGEPSNWWKILLAIGAGLGVGAFLIQQRQGLRRWGRRATWVPRIPFRDDPVEGKPARPKLAMLRPKAAGGSAALVELAVRAAGVLLTAVLSVGFVAFVGAAIVWMRFWAARYPADQAVDAVSREELLAIGAQALVLFAVLGALAVLVLWLLDGQGKAIRPTRRGLVVLIVAELLAALVIGEYAARQARELMLGFALGALLLVFVLDTLLQAVRDARGRPAWEVVKGAARRLFLPPMSRLHIVWQAVPLALLAFAFWKAMRVEHADDRLVFVGVPILLALLLFVAPGGVASEATGPGEPRLRAVRAILATVTLACLAAFLVQDEAWLAGAAAAALALAGLCLAVAAASGRRFLPFAVAVFVSVGVFGAVATCLRIIDSPQAQPVALLLDDGRLVCGVWVGDGDGRISVAQVELSELGGRRRPRPRRSGLTSFPQDAVLDRMVGPLQPIGRAQDQAIVLRDALEADHPRNPPQPPWRSAGTRCQRQPAPVPAVSSREHRIADRVQPELIVDRGDRFWPVRLRTLFAMEDRRARVCRRIAPPHICVRVRAQEDLPWAGGEGEWLDYPTDALHVGDEHDLMIDALESTDPARTAMEYFLVTRGPGPLAPLSVQFWFFYTFNYQPIAGGHAGYHQGDWESVGMLLSARTHRPRYVWMARHKEEGRVFAWGEDALQHPRGRLQVFAAKGSHASYENCSRQKRPDAPAGLIDDRPQCDERKQLHLAPENTALTDLSRVPWACWHGLFGHRPGDRVVDKVPYESADGPQGPLWQQRFGGVTSQPCRGVPDPGGRAGRGEEVLPDATAARLRRRAGRLDPLIDSCADWERAPASGAYLVACSPAQLRRYIDSGLEKPGREGLHIDIADNDAPVVGPATVPAVRRDPLKRRLDDWRVASTAPIVANVYASCQAGRGLLEVRFPGVRVTPDNKLRVDDRQRKLWRLRDEQGATVSAAAPQVVRKLKKKAPLACG